MAKELYETIIGNVVVSKARIIDRAKNTKEEMLKKHRGTNLSNNALDDFKELYPLFFEENVKQTRRQIKKSITPDLLVVVLFNSIEAITESANILSKRLRQWVGFYLPFLPKQIDDNKKIADLIMTKTRKQILDRFNIKEKDCMGVSFETKDDMVLLAKEIHELYVLREKESKRLKELTDKVCPNTSFILGAKLTANLLKHAGSLKKLMEMPASTIQLLGAEKALFRHMKTGAKSPKHGIIKAHPLIAKNPKKLHGKIARNIADKTSLAVKVDYFKGKFIGDKLKKDLIKKFGDY